MTRIRASQLQRLLRGATARVSILSLLLVILTADALHNHPGPEPGSGPVPIARGADLRAPGSAAVPGHLLPCPACLLQRILCMERFERAPEGRMAAAPLGRIPPGPPPPRPPVVSRTDLRAPPSNS